MKKPVPIEKDHMDVVIREGRKLRRHSSFAGGAAGGVENGNAEADGVGALGMSGRKASPEKTLGSRRQTFVIKSYIESENTLIDDLRKDFNVVTVADDEEGSVDDVRNLPMFYSDRSLLARESIKFDAEIRATLLTLWRACDIDASGDLRKQEYIELHKCVGLLGLEVWLLFELKLD